MRTRELVLAGVLALAFLFGADSRAAETTGGFRVRYAEPIGVTGADLRRDATSTKPQGAELLSFQAYGRQFDLELESNNRLLNALTVVQKRELADYSLFRGQVRGLPGSWVRLTRVGTELHGVIWDGSDLYSIAPARDVIPFMDQPLQVTADLSMVYRLSDTVSAPKACVIKRPHGEDTRSASGLSDYTKLIAELRASTSQLADRQIEIALLGDLEFNSRFAADPHGAALARINIVDGIFGEQVGVVIVIPMFRIGDFAGTLADQLLQRLSDYRLATPDVAAAGVAHLLTGKALQNNIAGVAYLGSLCDAEFGVGLSESWHPVTLSALIAAHEIGHNFNAPHDGVDGSPCVNTSQSYIMSPVVGFGTEFSRCSVNEMYFAMETATCLMPANVPDAGVTSNGLVAATLGQPFDLPFDVASVGTADIASAQVTLAIPPGMTFVSATVAGGTCSANAGTVSCDPGALPMGTSRAGNVRLTTQTAGVRDVEFRVTASGDRRTANDTDIVRIDAGTGADLSLGVSPARVDAFSDESFSFSVVAASVGTAPVDNVRVTLNVGNLVIEDLQAPGATCTAPSPIQCTYGTLAPGERRQIDIRANSTIARDFPLQIFGQANNDSNGNNNNQAVRLVIESARDVMVLVQLEDNLAHYRRVGESFETRYTVSSIGARAVDNVVLRVTTPAGFVVESATLAGNACSINAPTIECTIGTMPARSSRLFALRGHGVTETGGGFVARVTATNDDNPANDADSISIQISHSIDAEMSIVHPSQSIEGIPFQVNAHFGNRGVDTVANATLTLTLPASFEVLQASVLGGSCTVNANTSVCTLPTMPRNTGSHVAYQVRGSQTGIHQGTATIAVANDGNAANNSYLFGMFVQADVDITVTGVPALIGSIVGVPVDIPVTVRTGLRGISNTTLTLISGAGIGFDSITPQLPCTPAASSVRCVLGNLPGQSQITFTMRVRFLNEVRINSLFQVAGQDDVNPNNNTLNFTVDVGQPGDASLRITSASVTGTAGAEIRVDASLSAGANPSHNVRVEVGIAAGATFFGSFQGSGSCTQNGNGMTCLLDTVAAGTTRSLGYYFVAQTPGSYPITLQVFSTNDTNQANNSAQVTATVTAAPPPPPPPPPPPSNNSGGGGGGSLGWLVIALLAGVRMAGFGRRIPVTRPGDGRSLH